MYQRLLVKMEYFTLQTHTALCGTRQGAAEGTGSCHHKATLYDTASQEVPDDWKKASVTPIFREEDPGNYQLAA